MSRRAAAAAAAVAVEAPAGANPVAAPVVSERRQRASQATEVSAAPAKAPAAHVDPAAGEAAATVAPTGRTRRHAQTAAAAVDTTTTGAAASTPAAASSSTKPNYDSMTYEQFVASLKQKSKREVVEELTTNYWQAASVGDQQQEEFTDGAGGYTYTELLTRVYTEHRARNPSHNQEQQRIQMPACKLERIGTKKTAVANFKAICDALNRGVEDVKVFIEKELSTQGSIDSSSCLILKLQNVKAVQFETVISKYADEYVKCHSCKKADSVLTKEGRITTLRCNVCQATRTVTGTGSTYTAVTGKRSKLRQANAL